MAHGDSAKLSIVYWGMGALGLALASLILVTLAAMSKADAAQSAAADAKTTASIVATDVAWIKQAVDRIEQRLGADRPKP